MKLTDDENVSIIQSIVLNFVSYKNVFLFNIVYTSNRTQYSSYSQLFVTSLKLWWHIVQNKYYSDG